MQNNDEKQAKRQPFYTYHGLPTEVKSGPDASAGGEDAETGAPASPEQLQAYEAMRKESEKETTQRNRRGRRFAVVGALAFALVLCTAGLFSEKLGLSGGETTSVGKGHMSAWGAQAMGMDAATFLKKQSWEKKKHESLKALSKMKNLRYALEFFESYPPKEIAAAPVLQTSLDTLAANYDALVGSMVSFTGTVYQKSTVTEEIELKSGNPSALLALSPGDQNATVSVLVIGSALNDIAKSDQIKITCLPVYYYSPDDGTGQADVFLITIPELVQKTAG